MMMMMMITMTNANDSLHGGIAFCNKILFFFFHFIFFTEQVDGLLSRNFVKYMVGTCFVSTKNSI